MRKVTNFILGGCLSRLGLPHSARANFPSHVARLRSRTEIVKICIQTVMF